MTQAKPLEQMSAQELYELAKAKEQEEAEREREGAKQRIDELKAKRREMFVEHKRQLSSLDREIRRLRGTSPRVSRGAGGGRGDMAQRVTDIVREAGTISTKDIRSKLEEQGFDVANLSQTLSYLKRTGRVTSPNRATYAAA